MTAAHMRAIADAAAAETLAEVRIARVAAVVSAHQPCHQCDGEQGMECNVINCAWNDLEALDDVYAEWRSFWAHVAEALAAAGLLADP